MLFDPATGLFSPTVNDLSRPGVHAAVSLDDGQVLLLNLGDETPAAGVADIFDLATNRFTPTGATNFAHPGPGSANGMLTRLLDDRVLVTGGATAEIWDPGTGAWTRTGDPVVSRFNHVAVLLPGGEVLLTGGFDGVSLNTASAEVYDPRTGSFSLVGSMGVKRAEHGVTLLRDGRVLIYGAASFSPFFATAELYHR